jgi:hypothetical protein
VRFDIFLDVARDKPDQSAQSHEWNRSRLYAVIEISEADAEPLSRLLLTQQVIAAAGITLYVRLHAQRAIVNLTTTDIARLSGDQSRVRICQLALKGLIPPKRVKGYEQHRYYNSKKAPVL